MVSATSRLFPEIKWAQRKEMCILTIELCQLEKQELNLTPEGVLTFEGNDNEGKIYGFDMEFFAEVDVEGSKWNIKGRHVIVTIAKKDQEAESWPRLTKEKVKNHKITIDWSRWQNSDDEGEEDKGVPDQEGMQGFGGGAGGMGGGGMPGGMGGMGGMPGMGGMGGGMPGMEGMGGMPGMGGMGGMPGMGGMGGGMPGMGGMGGMPGMEGLAGMMGGAGGAGGAGGMDMAKLQEMMAQMKGGAGGPGGELPDSDDDEHEEESTDPLKMATEEVEGEADPLAELEGESDKKDTM